MIPHSFRRRTARGAEVDADTSMALLRLFGLDRRLRVRVEGDGTFGQVFGQPNVTQVDLPFDRTAEGSPYLGEEGK